MKTLQSDVDKISKLADDKLVDQKRSVCKLYNYIILLVLIKTSDNVVTNPAILVNILVINTESRNRFSQNQC